MKPGSEAESPPGPMVSMFHIATVLASCPGSRWVSFVYCLSYICLRLEQHHHAHSNDGKSVALCSAAKSSAFLGIGGFFYNSFKVCTTLLGDGEFFKSFQILSCHGGEGLEKKWGREGKTESVTGGTLISLVIGKNVSGVGWLRVPAAYLLMLVSRKEQSQTTGGRESGGGTERPRTAASETEQFWLVHNTCGCCKREDTLWFPYDRNTDNWQRPEAGMRIGVTWVPFVDFAIIVIILGHTRKQETKSLQSYSTVFLRLFWYL